MKVAYIQQHLGLGDHIICNALIRNFAKQYDTVFLFVKKQNYNSVSFMYRDSNNIKLITMPLNVDWNGEIRFANSFKQTNPTADHIQVGFNYLQGSSALFDIKFYKQFNMDFNKRFEDFYLQRDLETEMELFKQLNVKEGKYILICNVGGPDFKTYDIDYEKYTEHKDLPIIYLSKLTDNIFDWIYTAENAMEIYAVDSAFRLMIDSFNLSNKKLYIHSRGTTSIAKSKHIWSILC